MSLPTHHEAGFEREPHEQVSVRDGLRKPLLDDPAPFGNAERPRADPRKRRTQRRDEDVGQTCERREGTLCGERR